MPWKKRTPPAERTADRAAARARALDLLTGRDFACQELYERLCVRFTGEAAAAAVADMVQLGLLDDRKYAAAKARSLLAQHRSRRAIADVLRRKGVERPVAEAVLEELYAPEGAPAGALPVGWAVNGAGPDAQAAEAPRDPELEAAAALVRRQYARRLAEGREDLVLAALARRGFSYRTARAALACAAQGAQPGEP